MRTLLIILSAIFLSLGGFPQTYDKKIADAINAGDWFALDSIYNAVPKDSISDFLEVNSRCFIGNRFNRPQVSIPAFEELLAVHSGELSDDQLIGSALMCAIDMNRIGNNAKAASLLTSIRESLIKADKSEKATILDSYIKQYEFLADYHPYALVIEGDAGIVPFKILPAGRSEKKGVHLYLEDSSLNGQPADILFDTGAAVNVITPSLMEEYDLIPLDVSTKVSGARSRNGAFAIAKEMKIGNIVVRDVPFYVLDITSNNAEADQYLQRMGIIIGSDLMLRLKDLTLDFENNNITVTTVTESVNNRTKPNLCFSSGMNLLANGTIQGESLLMNIDTGDVSYGALGKDFYKRNKKFIKSNGISTNIRKAGLGGADIYRGYEVSGMSLELGGNKVIMPNMEVLEKSDCFGYDCNIGLKSLMLFKTVRFNLVDFVLITASAD